MRHLLLPTAAAAARSTFNRHWVDGDARAFIRSVTRRLLQLHSCRHTESHDRQAAESTKCRRSHRQRYSQVRPRYVSTSVGHTELLWLNVPERVRYELGVRLSTWSSTSVPYQLLLTSLWRPNKTVSSLRLPPSSYYTTLSTQYLWSSGLFCGWLDGLDLSLSLSDNHWLVFTLWKRFCFRHPSSFSALGML